MVWRRLSRQPPAVSFKLRPKTEAQKEAAAEMAAGPRGDLHGPFIALPRSPGLVAPVQKGEYIRFHCLLDRRVNEA